MKKIFLSLLLVMTVVFMSGCWNAEISSNMSITSKDGAGTKTLQIVILKDSADKPDGTGAVSDNSTYFNGGFAALNQWITDHTPQGYNVNISEQSDRWVYTLSYSFKDLKDYNAKTKALIGADRYQSLGIQPATLTAKSAKNSNGDRGYKLTFSESKDVLYASVAWAIEGVFNDSDLFNPDPAGTGAVAITDIYQLTDVKMTVGDKTTDFDLTADKNASLTDITASGWVKGGSTNVLYYIIAGVGAVVIAGASITAVLKTRKK